MGRFGSVERGRWAAVIDLIGADLLMVAELLMVAVVCDWLERRLGRRCLVLYPGEKGVVRYQDVQ
jgi:hypothetical protein